MRIWELLREAGEEGTNLPMGSSMNATGAPLGPLAWPASTASPENVAPTSTVMDNMPAISSPTPVSTSQTTGATAPPAAQTPQAPPVGAATTAPSPSPTTPKPSVPPPTTVGSTGATPIPTATPTTPPPTNPGQNLNVKNSTAL